MFRRNNIENGFNGNLSMENLNKIIELKIRTSLELSGHKFLNMDNDEDIQYLKDVHWDLYNRVLYRDYIKYIVLLFIDDENYITLMWRTMEHMLFNIGRQPGEDYDIQFSLNYYNKYKSIINFNDKMDALIHVRGDSLEEVIIKTDLMGI
jgi:phage repressor protein C with HTH and peptisase S24 domain